MNGQDFNPVITDVPDFQAKVHDISNIYFTITNFGILGSMSGNYVDPDWQGRMPGTEFPAGSEIEHLFIGALWIGAEVDTVDEYGNPALDTLVSVGFDGWWGTMELLPSPTGEESLWEDNIIGDQEYYAVYYDTTTNPQYVTPDPIDMRYHIPLGLKITQNSICWRSSGYDEIFIINYNLENIGGRDLHNVWAGLYYDGDVAHISEPPYGEESGAMDDICGYLNYGEYGIAWLADNNGQPYGGQFDERSPVDVMCAGLVGSTTPDLQTNFNWWMSNLNTYLDYGPQLQSNFDQWGYFPCGGRGTPCGDIAKYRVMANGERDYDQIWTAIDHSSEGWIDMPPNASYIADGYETRFLLSCGPMEISAGETEVITIAYFGANNLHVDPLNFDHNLFERTYDSTSVARFYENLNFTDMRAKYDSAGSYYAHNYTNVPPGPPSDFRIDQWSDNQITLAWNRVSRPNLQEYRIYRGLEPGEYDPEPITPEGFIDTAFTDQNVETNTVYYYTIKASSIYGMEGGASEEVFINSGQPQTPTGLSATSRQVTINLTWDQNPDTDIYGYQIYRAGPGQEYMQLDFTTANEYSDNDVYIGRLYRYKITALDFSGNESYFSEPVTVYSMGLDSGILLVNCNREGGNPEYDSIMVFYENLLGNYQYYLLNDEPENMPLLSSFSTVIFICEHMTGYRYFDIYDNNSLFADYLDAGGNLLLAGTRLVTPSSAFSGILQFNQSDFMNRYMNIAGLDFPDIYNIEFTGGTAQTDPFTDFTVDSTRAERIEFPPIENFGRLPGMGTLIPADSSEVIFNYVSFDPDSSRYHDHPIGIIHHGANNITGVVEFPLYYVSEPTSFEIFQNLMEEFGEISLGADNFDEKLPLTTEIARNYPNPFNAETVLKYRIAKPGEISIAIFNIIGQKIATIRDGFESAGEHNVRWNAGSLPSGIYFARLTTLSETRTIKLTLLK